MKLMRFVGVFSIYDGLFDQKVLTRESFSIIAEDETEASLVVSRIILGCSAYKAGRTISIDDFRSVSVIIH